MSWKKRYHDALETLRCYEQRCCFLERKLQEANETNADYSLQLMRNAERDSNASRHRQFCDGATTWLGALTPDLLKAITILSGHQDDIQALHDAYYKGGIKYPWQP